MKHLMEKLEQLLELGGIKKDVTFLVLSGIALGASLVWAFANMERNLTHRHH